MYAKAERMIETYPLYRQAVQDLPGAAVELSTEMAQMTSMTLSTRCAIRRDS